MLQFICVLSGAAALVFETIWFRTAGLVVGSSIYSSSLVTAAFMTGLGLGNFAAIRRLSLVKFPRLTYAWVEAGIGIGGLAVALLLARLPSGLAPIFRALGDSAAIALARFCFMFLLLVVPSSLMGATLPLLATTAQAETTFARIAGSLYGWNTFGAFVGALAGEYVLIGRLGLRGTAFFAAGLSLLAATLAFITRRADAIPGDDALAPAREWRKAWRPLTTAFAAGFTLLALEIVWFRLVLLLLDSTTQAFACMLAVVLLGIALGSLGAGVLARWIGQSDDWLASVAALAALTTAMTYWTFDPRVKADSVHWIYLIVSARLIAPTTILSGLLFTLTGAAVRRRLKSHGGALGALTLANTAGAAAGPLVASFVLIPRLGIETSVFLVALLYLFIAALNWPSITHPAARIAAVSTGCVATLAMALFPFGLMERQFHQWALVRAGAAGLPVVAHKEGLETTVTYVQAELGGEPWYHRLITNSHSMSASNLAARRYMKLFAYLPVWLRGEIKTALLICFGVGNTARALVDSPGIERVDVVDLSPEILGLAHVPTWPRESPLSDRRVQTTIEDGRFFLQTTDRRFDLITGEPPPPRNAGVVNLYSQEFFSLVRDRLTDRGIASYWLPVHQLTEPDAKTIVAAFCAVFDDCSLWLGSANDWLLIGTRRGASLRFDKPEHSLLNVAALRDDLEDLDLREDSAMAALFVGDARYLRDFSQSIPPLSDNWPQRLSTRLPHPNEPFYDAVADAHARYSRFEKTISGLPFHLTPEMASVGDFERETFARRVSNGADPDETIRGLLRFGQPRAQKPLRLHAVGFDSRAVDITVRVSSAKRDTPGLDIAKGLSAFGDGDWVRAISLLENVRDLRSDHRIALVVSLCFAGRVKDADSAAAALNAPTVCSDGTRAALNAGLPQGTP